jgi:cytidine deaminase
VSDQRPLSDEDAALVERARAVIDARANGTTHTVCAAARGADGRVVTGINVYHFNGGPCAELVALGRAVEEGLGDLLRMVAVGDQGRGVLSPCGRCRQVMLDYFPSIEVIVPTADGPRVAPVASLLPFGRRIDPETT